MALNTEKIRKDFEILGKKIIYFDNACMSLKPRQVVGKINEYYKEYPGCAGRSEHRISKRVGEEVAKSRREISKFFNSKKDSEIIFTRNTTEGLNLVANSFGLKKNDAVLLSDKEHNSNLIPWLNLKNKIGIKVKFFKFGNMEDFEEKLSNEVKLVSVVHTSNLDGTSQDVKEIAKIAHGKNAKILVDAAQSAPHRELNVRNLDVDFLSCSGHKMLGPTGMGVLYGKFEELAKLSQFISGGETVKDSNYGSFVMEDIPERFEAGLQDYSGITGLGEAIRYLKKIGLGSISRHELELNKIITERLSGKVNILGGEDYRQRSGIFSFNIKGIDPKEIAGILNSSNIMIRAGMHCCHSWFNSHHLNGSARASLYFYNTKEECERFVEEVLKIIKLAR